MLEGHQGLLRDPALTPRSPARASALAASLRRSRPPARGARARPARQPADPRVAVRLGRGGGPDRVVRRARGALAASRGSSATAGARCRGGLGRALGSTRGRDRPAARSASPCSRWSSSPGYAGTQSALEQLRADVRLHHLLGRDGVRERAVRRRLRGASTRGGRSAGPPAGRCAAAGRRRAALPGAARALARGRRAARLHLDRARLRLGRGAAHAGDRGARLHGADARRPGRLRRRGVERGAARRSPSTSTSSRGSRSSSAATASSACARRSAACRGSTRCAGTVAFVVVMIGTVTFDGLSQGALWGDLTGDAGDRRAGARRATLGLRRSASRSSAASTRSGSPAPARWAAASAPSACAAASSTRWCRSRSSTSPRTT